MGEPTQEESHLRRVRLRNHAARHSQPLLRLSLLRTVPDMDCFQGKIYEDDIVEMVIEAIRVCAHLAVEEKHLRAVEKEKREMQLHTLQ